jgi:hypothetical protein
MILYNIISRNIFNPKLSSASESPPTLKINAIAPKMSFFIGIVLFKNKIEVIDVENNKECQKEEGI